MDMLFPIKLLPRVLNDKNGVSSRFNEFITGLDKKYVHSQDPNSKVNQQLQKAQASYEKSGIDQKLRKYFEDAVNCHWV